MAIKLCSYHNCTNYIRNDVYSGDFTIFGFPKDERRRQEWILLGNVKNYGPNSRFFMCSDHFESKYICVQSRRKFLIGEAKPVPYTVKNVFENPTKEKEIEIEFDIDKEKEIKTELEIDNSSDDNDNVLEESISINSDDERNTKSTGVSLTGKRFSSASGSEISSTKKPKLQMLCEEISNHGSRTFICKGEKYIVMPLTQYMKESKEREEKIKRYQMSIKQIKSLLTKLENDLEEPISYQGRIHKNAKVELHEKK